MPVKRGKGNERGRPPNTNSKCYCNDRFGNSHPHSDPKANDGV